MNRWWRRHPGGNASGRADPAHGRDGLLDPVEAFMDLGIPRDAAAWAVRLLRQDVTDRVCALLPGLPDATGCRWLWVASVALPQVAPQIVAPALHGMAPGRDVTAALPAIWLLPIAVEVMARHDARHPATPIARRPPGGPPPDPSPRLHGLLLEQRARPDRILLNGAPLDRTLRDAGTAVASLLPSLLDPAEDSAWGGWALWAAEVAFADYADALPMPGRSRPRPESAQTGADAAGIAFRFGHALLAAAALALLDGQPRTAPS